MPRKLILKHKFAMGDCVCFTSLPRDIHAAYPGQFDITVDTHFTDIWWNNPHARCVEAHDYKSNPLQVDISYQQGIKESGKGRKIHMLAWYHQDFANKTGMPLSPTLPNGDLHLNDAEKEPIVGGKYWVMLSGGKLDCTVKHWWLDRWQRVVDMLLERGIHCVQAGVLYKDHVHPPLKNVTNMVGKYDGARQFFNLIMNSEGVICPITGAMHIAACYQKPCVVIAGGREDPWWEGYVNAYGAFGPSCEPMKVEHRYLHTLSRLDCCDTKGCWKHRVVPLGLKDKWDKPFRICKNPMTQNEQHVAKCMDMVTERHVVDAVMSYYEDGTLTKPGAAVVTKPKHDSPQIIPPEKLSIQPLLLPTFVSPAIVPSPPVVKKVSAAPRQPRPDQLKPPVAKIEAPAARPEASPLSSMDHPLIGGKYTVFVLCYGPHPELAKTCLGSLLATVPIERLDIRVGCNACDPATIKYLEGLPLTKMYVHPENAKKYPVMREMLWDKKYPIGTRYMVWLDDDAKAVDPNWAGKLADTIVANHPHGSRLYGQKYIHDLKPYAKDGHNPVKWFQQAPWWQGRHLRVRGRGDEAPNGTVIEFVSGWFWAAATEAIRQANVPDIRLNHNGGDITIGEQFHQAGYKVKMFNNHKTHWWCPSREKGGRRGYQEKFPWQAKLDAVTA